MSGKTNPETTEPGSADRDTILRDAMSAYEGPLVGYAVGIVSDLERARDVVQDTFVKLFKQEPGKIQMPALKSWLYTVCRNRALDVLRKEKRVVSLEGADMPEMRSYDPDPSEATERREAHDEAVHFLNRLPENQREVIRLKFQSGLSYKEISEITSLSVSNVGFLIHTGLKRLRKIIPNQEALTKPRIPNRTHLKRSNELS